MPFLVELPDQAPLSPIDLYASQLQSWHITPQVADTLQLSLVSNQAARLSLGWIKASEKRPGIRIPIFDVYGEQVDYRIRWLGPIPSIPEIPPPHLSQEEFRKKWEKDHGKYAGRSGTPSPIYFPPTIKWINPPEHIIITEGEIKAATATLFNFPTIGLIGWFGGLIAQSTSLKPGLDYIATHPNVKRITILWDSDAASPQSDPKKKAQAMLAITRLTLGLERAAREVSKQLEIKYAFIPDLITEGKTGLDDFLHAQGSLGHILNSAADAYANILSPQFFADCAHQGIYVRGMDCFWEPDSNGGRGQFSTVKAFSNWMSKYLPPEGVPSLTGPGKKMLKFGDYMSFIGRRDAEFVDFIPGMDKELPEGGYNVWEPDWVDTVPYQTSTLFNRFFLRWYDAFFHKPKQREEVRLWIAHLFLCPSIRHEIMLVLWGSGGSGKSLLLEHFIPRSISYNRRWCREWSHIGQRFDDSLRNSQYVYAAEIYSNEMTHTAMSAYLKKMTTQDTIRGEVKGGGYYEMKNLSGKAMSLNCSHRIDIEYGNRRVFFPDIPKDTDNYPSHPIRLMAKELWEVYEHSTEDNKKELLGAFRSWVEDAGERVHERYVNINMRTDSARELAGSANPAEYLATDFLESIPDWFTPDIIATNHLRVFPQFKELSINEWNSIMQRNKSVLIPVASGKTYKIADGIVPRFRIIRNAQKWLDPNSDAVREQYKLADQQITQALNTRKF